jgi:hypothetical protein
MYESCREVGKLFTTTSKTFMNMASKFAPSLQRKVENI